MSSLKSFLKQAKGALEQNDPEEALEYANEALKIDSKSYYAYVFQGKAYQLIGDLAKAMQSFRKATQIEETNVLAWKGCLQLSKSSDDYETFFNVLTSLCKIYIDQGISIADLLQTLREYLDAHKVKDNDQLFEFYLRSILPGTKLGDLIGTSIENPDFTYKKLLDFKQKQIEKDVVAQVSKERVKFGKTLSLDQKAKLDAFAWSIYNKADLLELYDAFLNICDDDGLRQKYKEKCLKFKYELLKVSPEKQTLILDIRQSVEDMILLKTKSLFCWNLYFDWMDIASLDMLDEEFVIEYLQLFQNESLGPVLFAFVMSDISPFNKEKIIKELSFPGGEQKRNPSVISKTMPELSEIKELVDDDENVDNNDFSSLYMPQDEVIDLMLTGYSKAKESVLANRILIHFFIHLREYNTASERCRDGIRLLAEMQRTFGLDLPKTKIDFLCSLAVVYTYHEAPKNFSRALQLYDKILESDSTNVEAKVGKGLICVERGALTEARTILESVVEEHPDNLEAKSEYCWCLVKLGQTEKGRSGLQKFIESVVGGDLHSREVRAIANWRIAQSYMAEKQVQECYKHLILSLKDNDAYAPSYTLLGILFAESFNDVKRAQKCFYKAFDLDPNEIEAARYLVKHATAENEWDVAQVLAKRVVTSEHSRRLIMRGGIPDAAWPYRVLGSGALNDQDDAKAVEWFQNALRIDSNDFASWVGLGEAYSNCGRLEAASKVFRHALTIDNGDSWTVKYMLGHVLCEMKEFNEGLSFLYAALESQPNEECILSAIYEANIENAEKFLQLGFTGRAINAVLKSLGFVKQSLALNKASQKAWKRLGDILRVLSIAQEYIQAEPLIQVLQIFKNCGWDNDATLLEKYLVSIEDICTAIGVSSNGISTSIATTTDTSTNSKEKVQAIRKLVVLAAAAGLEHLPLKANRAMKATALYNLGLAYLESFQHNKIEKHREASIKHLKHAIKIESNNASFWIALGNVYSFTEPLIAQHCYIKGMSLEVKDAGIWVNLAVLYLKHGDYQLAQETFMRAQSVTPQDSQPWLGNAMIEELSGDLNKAQAQYTHAFTVSKGRSAVAQLLYAMSVTSKAKTSINPKDIETAQELSISNQAMHQYLKLYPEELRALRVGVESAERCKDYDSALEMCQKLCSLYESMYEETEDSDVLEHYLIGKCQMARISLGLQEYDKVIDIVQEVEQFESKSLVVEANIRICLGLAYYFTGKFEDAVLQLRVLVDSHAQSSEIISLVAQMLYAHDSPQSKQAAVDQLFAHIEEYGSSSLLVVLLGAISVVENLEEYFEAIKEELSNLSLAEVVADTRRDIPRILEEISVREGDKSYNEAWLRSAFLFPSSYQIWRNIDSGIAKKIVDLGDSKITADEYAEAMKKGGTVRDVQRSLMLNPCDIEAMQQLTSSLLA